MILTKFQKELRLSRKTKYPMNFVSIRMCDDEIWCMYKLLHRVYSRLSPSQQQFADDFFNKYDLLLNS